MDWLIRMMFVCTAIPDAAACGAQDQVWDCSCVCTTVGSDKDAPEQQSESCLLPNGCRASTSGCNVGIAHEYFLENSGGGFRLSVPYHSMADARKLCICQKLHMLAFARSPVIVCFHSISILLLERIFVRDFVPVTRRK